MNDCQVDILHPPGETLAEVLDLSLYDGCEEYVESSRDRSKTGTEKGQPNNARRAFDAILNVPRVQARIAEKGLPTTVSAWAALVANQVSTALSPPARRAFDSLCAQGCHPVVLGFILSFEPRHVRSALELIGGPRQGKQRTKAIRTLKAAVAVLGEWETPAVKRDPAVRPEDRDKALTAVFGPVFQTAGRTFPLVLAKHLAACVQVLKVSAAFGTRAEGYLPRFILTAYVKAATAKEYDGNIAVLVAECYSSPSYNAAQQKTWRTRHFDKLEKQLDLVADLRQIDQDAWSTLPK